LKKRFYKKWWFWVIIFIFVIASFSAGKDKKTSAVNNDKVVPVAQSEKPKEAEKVTVPEKPLTLNEYLENTVTTTLGKETNEKKPKFMGIEDVDGGKNIIINADANITNSLTARGMLMDAKKYFQEIQKNNEAMKLKDIALIFHMMLVDKYGNEKDSIVCSITFMPATLNKIKWDNVLTDNIGKIADQYYLAPALK